MTTSDQFVLHPALLQRLYRDRDGLWIFFDKPLSPHEFLATLEYLQKQAAGFLSYRELYRIPVGPACTSVKAFLQNQDFILAAENEDPSTLEGYAAEAGCAWAEWQLLSRQRRAAHVLDVLSIDIAILEDERLFAAFRHAGSERLKDRDEEAGLGPYFRQMLDHWKQWHTKGVRGIPKDLAHCFKRHYRSTPDETRRIEARQRIGMGEGAGAARVRLVRMERLCRRRDSESEWELTDAVVPLEIFWAVIAHVYYNGGRLLRYQATDVFVPRVAKIQHELFQHQLRMEKIPGEELDRLEVLTEELGGLYACLVLELGTTYRRDWAHLRFLNGALLKTAYMERAFFRGFCERVRDPNSRHCQAIGERPVEAKEKLVSHFFFVMELSRFCNEYFDIEQILNRVDAVIQGPESLQ